MIKDNFKLHGSFNITDIHNKLKNVDWNYFTWRQKNRRSLEYTETIPLIWDNDFTDYNIWKYYELFEDELGRLKSIITSTHGPGEYITAIFTKLIAGRDIAPHIDVGRTFIENPRLHIPIITNPDCLFTVGNETVNMKEGEIWEINNSGKIHSVHNKGTTDRIHLMVDWKLDKK
jgi:hypothetical protein